jgi:hypothetical protein
MIGAMGGHDFSAKVGLDGQFSMSAVDEDGEADFLWSSMFHQSIECGSGGSAGEDDFIDQDDGFASDLEGDFGFVVLGGRAVVSIEPDIEFAAGHGGAFDLSHEECKPFCDGPSPAQDSDYDESVGALIGFEDFVRHATKGSAHVSGI